MSLSRFCWHILFLSVLALHAPLRAEVTLLIGEPFGAFGAFNPTGHAAVYLSRVCAESPVKLRMCQPGESGVVISRYNRVAGFDWLAVPLLPYLYAVENPGEVPDWVDARTVAKLRDGYRRLHLRQIAPDREDEEIPRGDWIQLVGSAYDRSLHGFTLPTTPEEDERLVAYLNQRPNERRFNLFYRNCADFAQEIINFYYPRAVRRSFVADLAISTPKHAAKALVRYTRSRPELSYSQFMIPQIPGRRPSTNLRGVNESLIRSKKYAAPLIILQPWVAATAATAYLVSGRFNPAAGPQAVCEPAALETCMEPGNGPLLVSSQESAAHGGN